MNRIHSFNGNTQKQLDEQINDFAKAWSLNPIHISAYQVGYKHYASVVFEETYIQIAEKE